MDVVCNHLLIAIEIISVVCLQALTGQEAQGSTLSGLSGSTHSLGAAALLPQTVASLASAPAETRPAAAAALNTADSAAWTPSTKAIGCPANGKSMVCSPPAS